MGEEIMNQPAAELPVTTEDSWLAANDFRSSSNWRIFRIMAEFVEGWHFLADHKKTVTFFGSARLKPGTKWYTEASKLAKKLALDGFSIVTGGGPGIMEAANRGAMEARHTMNGSGKKKAGESIGLNIELPHEQRVNRYVMQSRGFHYFFVRKVMLSYHARAYVFFPGGLGTLDETFELLTLIQTHKIDFLPVVLVGKEFWTPLVDWLNTTCYKKFNAIDKGDMNIYSLVDEVDDAYKIISEWYTEKHPDPLR